MSALPALFGLVSGPIAGFLFGGVLAWKRPNIETSRFTTICGCGLLFSSMYIYWDATREKRIIPGYGPQGANLELGFGLFVFTAILTTFITYQIGRKFFNK